MADPSPKEEERMVTVEAAMHDLASTMGRGRFAMLNGDTRKATEEYDASAEAIGRLRAALSAPDASRVSGEGEWMPDQQVRGLVDLLESLGYGTAADVVAQRNRGAIEIPFDNDDDPRVEVLRDLFPELFDARRPILKVTRTRGH